MTAQIESALVNRPHVRPLGSQVVIVASKEEVIESRTPGGLYVNVRRSEGGVDIPDSVDDEPVEGRVVALGDGYREACPTCYPNGKRYEFEVKIGDRVLWCPWSAVTVSLGDVEYQICDERDLMVIFVS